MIVTVSPNVALDRVHVVRGFQPGQQSRALKSLVQPGGSGVHASMVIQALGGKSLALGLLGGRTGDLWRAEATRVGLAHEMVSIGGETRESFCLVDLDLGDLVESVEPGPRVDASCLPALLERLERQLPQAEMLILSGSVPPGFPDDGYTEMLELARSHEVPVIADLHGGHLRRVLAHGPWLVKPSLDEFHELISRHTDTLRERALACEVLFREWGVIIALSMSAQGLLVTGPGVQWLLEPPPLDVHLPGGRGRNAIGCGDALVGALAFEYCATRDLVAAVRLGVAAAQTNLGTFGASQIDPEESRRLAKAIALEVVDTS